MRQSFARNFMVAAALLTVLAAPKTSFSSKPKFPKSEACKVEPPFLSYGSGRNLKRMLFSTADGEQILDKRCGKANTVILTTAGVYLYPGSKLLGVMQPRHLSYTRIGLDHIDGGAISQTDDLFVVTKGSRVEAYSFRGFLRNALSVEFDSPVVAVYFDSKTSKIIVVDSTGNRSQFDSGVSNKQ